MDKPISAPVYRLTIWIVIAAHVAVTATLAWYLNIWADESCTLYATAGSPASVFRKALFFEWQPPAYHVALGLWRHLNSSPFFARCFSIVCSCVTIATVHVIAKKLNVKRPILPAILFAAHPFAVYLAIEIRPYGFATMISAALLLTWVQAYFLVSESGSTRMHAWIAGFGLYTNILLGIPLTAQALIILLFRRREHFQRFAIRLLVVGAAFAPMFLLQLSIAQKTELPQRFNTISNLATFMLGSLEYMVLPLPRMDATLVLRTSLLVMLLLFCIAVGYRQRSRLSDTHRFVMTYLGATAMGLAMFIYVTDLARAERYTYVIAVPAIIAWSVLLDLVSDRRVRIAAWSLSLVLCLVSLFVIYQPMCKSGDWIRVARHLQASEQINQPIVAFPSEVQTLLSYYYTGINEVVPVPGPQRFDRFTTADFRISDRETITAVLEPILRESHDVMLVTFDPAIYRSESNDPLNFAVLESYLAESFQELDRQEFVGTTIRRLKRKSSD